MVTACKVGCLQTKGSTDLSEANIKDGPYLCDDCRVSTTTSSPFEKDNRNPNVAIDTYQKPTAVPTSLSDPAYRIMPGFVYPTSYIGSGVKKLPFTSSSRLLNIPAKTSSNSRGHTTKRDCGQCADRMNLPVSLQSQYGPTSRLAGGGCFSSDMQVNLGNRYKRMDQLNLGDHVLVDAYKMQMVDTMIHRNPSVETDFIVLTTQSNRSLTLTPEHLIPLMHCNDKTISLDNLELLASRWSQFASKATTEHCVIVLDAQAGVLLDRITTVGRVRKRGVFSPVTSQGTLVVNDVFVSCFSTLENHNFQLLFHKATKSVRQLLNMLTRLFRSQHCSYTRISWDSLYIESLMRLAQWASSMGIL
ncbi:Hint module family protein [Trichuris trichiura]|uniref:Hint module family protein n=1 Tax=Trichuris trichiura TaxID=36087 RepID=A0A077Z208_TRITR|nr:Hint module family protein [Trichuris trichiura]